MPQRYACDDSGTLQIIWPHGLEDYDFLIATSTKAESDLTKISPEIIVQYIGNRDYFIPNIKNGIKTFQDKDIEEMISKYSRFKN